MAQRYEVGGRGGFYTSFRLKLRVWLIPGIEFLLEKRGTREYDIWAEVLTVDTIWFSEFQIIPT